MKNIPLKPMRWHKKSDKDTRNTRNKKCKDILTYLKNKRR